jgi:hypothetical protein
MLGSTEIIMDYVWRYERKQMPEEMEWHRYIYGEDYGNRYFTRVNEKRSRLQGIIGKTEKERKRAKAVADTDYKTCREAGDNQSPKYKRACEILEHFAGTETTDSIKSWSYSLYQKLSSKEYDDVRANYSIIADALIMIAYPDFMKNIFQPAQ